MAASVHIPRPCHAALAPRSSFWDGPHGNRAAIVNHSSTLIAILNELLDLKGLVLKAWFCGHLPSFDPSCGDSHANCSGTYVETRE